MKNAADSHLPRPTPPAPTQLSVTTPALAARQYNTKNLGWRLGTDAVSALCAGSLIAPIISIIDRSIMENASGRGTLANSIFTSLRALLRRPSSVLFSKPCGLILMVYGGTYLTANTLDTASSTIANRPASRVTSGPAKFAASSASNIALGIYKDQVFVRLFGPPGAVPRPVGPASYALFAVRDCLTIFASFNVPPLIAPSIAKYMPKDGGVAPATVAQFLAPAAVQFASTPLHLLGLDLYNQPSSRHAKVPFRERWETVGKNWLVSSSARICRIIPAFGVGGVVNMKVRGSLMKKLE